MPPELDTLAFCATDNSVEALQARNLPWLGLMWHPDREAEAHPADLELLQRYLRLAP